MSDEVIENTPPIKRRLFNPMALISYLIACAIVLFVDFVFLNKPVIPYIPRLPAIIIGSCVFAFGLFLMLATIYTLRSAVKDNKLITTGILGIMRHPIYASFSFYLTPGGALILNKLTGLVVLPIIQYFILEFWIVKKEEETLIKIFGQAYLDYKKEVNAYFPTFKC